MTPTVHDLRNEIRVAVGRFEREIATDFTKEDLAAICGALDEDVGGKPLPPKPEMRRRIITALGEDGDGESSFRKGELVAIAAAVGN